MRILDPVFESIWWNCTFLRETAPYSFTGMLTRPKLIDPLQMARGMTCLSVLSVCLVCLDAVDVVCRLRRRCLAELIGRVLVYPSAPVSTSAGLLSILMPLYDE